MRGRQAMDSELSRFRQLAARLTANIRACNAPMPARQGHERATTMFTLATMRAPKLRPASSGTLLARCALVLATVWFAPCLAQAKAPAGGTLSPSLWTRDTLGGDWGGMRSTLGQQGIRFDFWATGFYQDVLQGAGNDDGDFSGRVDLMINDDTGKLGLWQGGGLHAHVTYRGGDLPGFRGGALFPVHTSGCYRWVARTMSSRPRCS